MSATPVTGFSASSTVAPEVFLLRYWESACLDFHEGQRPVRTASVSQVRQPIYQRSVARWKHYESALCALFDRLEHKPAVVT